MQLRHDLFDIVSVAIMNNEPIVIVEGKDDYQVYDKLAKLANTKIQIYQTKEFENFEEGCTGVISCIETLQPKFEERPDVINKVLGIIDRDVRPFRNEMPDNLKGIFVTKHYSIETYFATRNNLLKLINKITFTTPREVVDTILDLAEDNFNQSIDDLFLISLEALKNACEKDYKGIVGYENTEKQIIAVDFRQHLLDQLGKKRAELMSFAANKNVVAKDIKFIAKGKWYLYSFAHYTFNKIQEFKEECRKGSISQCRSCLVGNHNDCLFKLKQDNYKVESLNNDLLEFIDEYECDDIIQKFKMLV